MRFKNPFKAFSLDELSLEIRYDPLTGQTSRVFDLPYEPIEKPDFKAMMQQTQDMPCPFCPESIQKATTLYPEDIIPEGRVNIGEAHLFPNLLPLDRYTGVCVMTETHFVALEDLTADIMKDAFMAALSFIKRVSEGDPQVRFFNVNWNYMPPAGSSIVHPHLQVNCGRIPTRQVQLQFESSQKYYLENGRTYWHDYMTAEREAGERFLTDLGSTFWTLGFAPQGALPDICCIFPDHSSLLELRDEDVEPFVKGLESSIKYIEGEGLYSFNVSIFSGRNNEYFRVNGRITPRLLLRQIGNSDQTYYQVLHREPCSMKPPESVREKVRAYFTRETVDADV